MIGYAGVMSLVGDLYSFQDLLSADESATVTRVREFLASEVAPIANDCWERAEFPFQLVKGYAGLGIAGVGGSPCVPSRTPTSP